MTISDQVLKLVEQKRRYHVYKYRVPFNQIPDNLTQAPGEGSTIDRLKEYLSDMGEKDLDLDDNSGTLQTLGVKNLQSPVMVDDLGSGEWAVSCFKEPAYLLKEV